MMHRDHRLLARVTFFEDTPATRDTLGFENADEPRVIGGYLVAAAKADVAAIRGLKT